jgi:hypothetical protein
MTTTKKKNGTKRNRVTTRQSERAQHVAGGEDAEAPRNAREVQPLVPRQSLRNLPMANRGDGQRLVVPGPSEEIPAVSRMAMAQNEIIDASEDETEGDEEEQVEFYTCEKVDEAIERVAGYQESKIGPGYCLNVANNKSGCSCLSELLNLKKKTDTEVEYYTACEEMTLWFNGMENLEASKEQGLTDQSTISNNLGQCVFIKPRYGGRCHGTVVNMSTTDGFPSERSQALEVTKWKGHDWDTTDKELQFPFHSAMCLPSAMMVWRALVGGVKWLESNVSEVQKWLGRDYHSLIRKIGVQEIQQKKTKQRQRLFYARILDYMEAKSDAQIVKFKIAFEIHSKNNWLVGMGSRASKNKSTFRKDWEKWKLNTIHVLRANTKLNYNSTLRTLQEKLNIRISTIGNETVDFLEELFGEIRDCLNKKRKWEHVARDHKLLYRPFANCHNIKTGIDGYFTRLGGGGRLPAQVQERKNKPNNDYKNQIGKCDAEIKEALISMTTLEVENLAFQPSLVISEVHKPQGAHIDYDTAMGYDQKYMIAFLPLTETGQFLQLWEKSVDDEEIRGKVVFIPRGQLVLVPGNTIHGGGFRADIRSDNIHAHMRLHFYVYPGETTSQIDQHKNEYMDESLYLQNSELLCDEKSLQKRFFDG